MRENVLLSVDHSAEDSIAGLRRKVICFFCSSDNGLEKETKIFEKSATLAAFIFGETEATEGRDASVSFLLLPPKRKEKRKITKTTRIIPVEIKKNLYFFISSINTIVALQSREQGKGYSLCSTLIQDIYAFVTKNLNLVSQ